jgi:hypothetical protein
VRVHAGQFLDETDIAVIGFEIHRGEREPALFHSPPPAGITSERLRDEAYKSMSAGRKLQNKLILQNHCGRNDHNLLRRRIFVAARFVFAALLSAPADFFSA